MRWRRNQDTIIEYVRYAMPPPKNSALWRKASDSVISFSIEMVMMNSAANCSGSDFLPYTTIMLAVKVTISSAMRSDQ